MFVQLCFCSALALLVARVLADHHDAAVATDHLALVTDGLDAGLDLHRSCPSLLGCRLIVAVDDPTPGEVVRRELHHDPVLGEDPDVVLSHLAADVGENLVPVAQLHAEHRVREGLHDGALDLDHAFFLRHVLHNLLIGCLPWPGNLHPGGAVDLVQPLVHLIPGTRANHSKAIRAGFRTAARHHEADPRWAD